eukprot:TRINITY_DN2027_c0_g1_i1.p1 TRINITY_DN2027_c0_g1~~TRINITY_DN2027_c0_g1_i1.p1  ORF type:complete len:420 (+),score=109.72 TRINITY_DN2027_c0_g1_i1:23-1261(+)
MAEEKGISNSGVFDCEWRKRPINLMSVLRSFVSQLRPGDELTKMSLPSELCHPFSMLELISLRQVSYFHVLFGTNKATDDEGRFLAALKWLAALLQAEIMEKKPFNPVIGEQHICWVEHSADDWTEFVSEQVSHHPPISSFFMRNKKQQIEVEGNLKFGVKFGGNHAAVTTAGPVKIKTQFGTFHLDKSVPNMIVQNVVWGVKYVMWSGDITLSCPETGYSATLTLSEVDPTHNRIEGKVTKNGEEVFEVYGQCGVLVEVWPVGNEEKKTVLFTAEDNKLDTLSYPPPSAQVETDSLALWKAASDAIIANDLYTADAEKIKVETAQRAREKGRKEAGLPYDAKFFINAEDDEESANWTFKNEITVNREFIEQLKKQKIAEDEERQKREAEAEAAQTGEAGEGQEGGENCLLQ